MVTITSNYSEKLRQKIVNEETTRLVNFFGGEDKKTSRKEAARIRRIVAIHLESKVRNYYNERQYTFSRGVDEALETLRDIGSAQSKAERIFYVKLVEQKIPFYFQYPVGPYYTADYLIDEILDVELDGPYHNNPLPCPFYAPGELPGRVSSTHSLSYLVAIYYFLYFIKDSYKVDR